APVNQLTQEPIEQEYEQIYASFSLARAATLVDRQDGQAEQHVSANLDLSKALSAKMYLSGSLSYENNLKYPEYNDFSDVYLSLSHTDAGSLENWRLPVALNTVLPASKMSTRINNLQMGLIASTGISSKPSLFKS